MVAGLFAASKVFVIPFVLAYSSFAEKYANMYVSWQCWQWVLSPPVVPFSGASNFLCIHLFILSANCSLSG